ncbi:hypothetical protein BCR36DRAFT_403127 [Piromyces finnis]|uniref:AAA+ ATPase domain-containing protein n=1 Tax=Piromyces finnis TaxID=1754191 RepID=A0A1Y1VF59_9FUNG|nr:hypothetical protein BCR36DRAFT_403127 [Piromyces finnis]|eukprot:ORX54698.1 hypothetical protein BCR36DRAFT_403127 [Piromyces finnis]
MNPEAEKNPIQNTNLNNNINLIPIAPLQNDTSLGNGLDSNFLNSNNNSLSDFNNNSILNSNDDLKDVIFENSSFPPIRFEDEDDSDTNEKDNNNDSSNNNINFGTSLNKNEKNNSIDEEEEYFRSYKNMFESQLEPPPDINEDELLEDEEEMLKDILQEEENEYLQSMYEDNLVQQNQTLPASIPAPLKTQQELNNKDMNNKLIQNQSDTLNSSMKQKGKRPALDFEDEDELDFSPLNNERNKDNMNNPLNALNNYIPSSASYTQNTLDWEHKNKKSMPWDTGIGFSLTDESEEPLEWQQSSEKINMNNSILEWKEFIDNDHQTKTTSHPQQHAVHTTSDMNIDLNFGTTSDSSAGLTLNNPTKKITTSSGRNFTERPEAGTVYLTGYSYDNLPLYIPFKPIPTVNEIHRQNKELTVKNMNGQLLDVSIYHLLEEVEKEKKERKEIQEAKEIIQLYNNNENQEEYMEIWEDDKNKKKGKGKEGEENKKEHEKDLWVNAYTPKRYTDLLGDERVNREVLSWVKEWDYCVFQKKDYLKAQSTLNAIRNIDVNNNDKYKRPFKKIMLLAGPPGLGKTTLAHVIAKHCGYNVVEINASDDRTGNSVKNKLLSALEMQNITNGKPNLVIIDEIDGVSGKGSGDQNFIKLLVNIVTAESSQSTDKKRKRGKQLKPLMRPIICICNDQYTPVLKPLRTIAQIYSFKPPQPKQLAKRLKEICDNCNFQADIRSLLALCEITECDIRNCINTLQFINSKHEKLTLETLSSVSIGHKDLNKSLFNIWENVFTIPNARDKRSYTLGQNLKEENQNALSNRYISRLTALINSSGEYEKIIIGCFENYIKLKTVNFSSDPSKSKYVLVSEWLEFYDYINLHITKFAQFELSDYAIYPIISFYRYFSSTTLRSAFPLAPYQQNSGQNFNTINRYRKPQPILEYPRHDYESFVALSNNLNILNQFISGINSQLQYNGWNYNEVVSGLVSYLLRITEPNIKTSNVLLLKPDDRKKLDNLVGILVSFGMTCVQERVPDSTNYIYRLEPPIGHLIDFAADAYAKDQDQPQSNLSLFVKNKDKFGFDYVNYQMQQIVAQEVEMEKMRRIENSLIKSTTQELQNMSIDPNSNKNKKNEDKMAVDAKTKDSFQISKEDLEKVKENDRKRISELKKATTEGVINKVSKPIDGDEKKITNAIDMKEFFKAKTTENSTNKSSLKTESSHEIWFSYNEGYSNAVRTTVYIKDL